MAAGTIAPSNRPAWRHVVMMLAGAAAVATALFVPLHFGRFSPVLAVMAGWAGTLYFLFNAVVLDTRSTM
jgi:nucleoside phosphorylase